MFGLLLGAVWFDSVIIDFSELFGVILREFISLFIVSYYYWDKL